MEADRHAQRTMNTEAEAWRLRVEEGWTQQKVAQHLGISQQRVSQILTRAEKKFHGEFLSRVEEVKSEQTARLEQLYAETIAQWRRSCEDADRVTTITGRAKTTSEGDIIHLPDQETHTVEGQSGNPALLAQARGILADIRAIWGWEAPKQQELSAPGGGPVLVREVVVELPRGESE